MKNNRRNCIYLGVCLLYVLFITILSRSPSFTRTVHLDLLWSYTSSRYTFQILLNIIFFIPLGYFLATLTRPYFVLLIALTVSATVEAVQFLTYRGMLDVDDLVSNVLGVALGMVIHTLVERYEKKKDDGRRGKTALKKWTSWILLTAGLVGCIIVASSHVKGNIDVKITTQCAFYISYVEENNGKTVLVGECFLYDRDTPSYTILIDGTPAKTVVDGQMFMAETPRIEKKADIQVKFEGYNLYPTGTWINGDRVEYVAGVFPSISGVPEGAVLKTWDIEHDVLVYQDQDRILWLIGTPIDQNTEVIYHIYTTELEKLPVKRIQYGFENRGFRVNSDERAANELDGIDHYRVFEKKIPDVYCITAIVVGFNTQGVITWSNSFRVDIPNS